MANVSHFDIDGTVYDVTPASPVSVGNGTLTIQKNGANVQTFSANQNTNATANIAVPTKVSELTNDSGYTTNTGTVTQVKVGTTAYNPSSGVVSLPAYPTVNNATLTIQKNGTNVQTFTANQASNATANIAVPTKVSELTNDSGYTTNTGTVTQVKVGTTAYNPSSGVVSLPAYPTVNNATLTIQKNGTNVQTFTANQGSNATANITVPTKVSQLTNDSGYTTNTGTVTQVKVGTTAYNPSSGVVSLPAYPSVGNGTLTIQRNGSNVATFTANQGGNATANITVPTAVSQLTNDKAYITSGVVYLPSAVTVSCSNQVWKRLGYLTIPANKKCIITAVVKHSLANVGALISIGTADANDNTLTISIPAGAQTFDFHRTTLTGIQTTGSSATNMFCNVWLTGGSGNVTLSAFSAYYFD